MHWAREIKMLEIPKIWAVFYGFSSLSSLYTIRFQTSILLGDLSSWSKLEPLVSLPSI